MSADQDLRARFSKDHPEVFFLDPGDKPGLEAFLREKGWLGASDGLSEIRVAEDSNMNRVLRLRAGDRRIVLKQARPWVEKYPQFAAPVERALVEAAYYAVTAELAREAGPRLVFSDPASFCLATEDLWPCEDLRGIYENPASLRPRELRDLMAYLARLHALPRPGSEVFANRGMRALNHAHIFVLPFTPGQGPALDAILPGLAALAEPIFDSPSRRAELRALGEIYLADGPALVHGDFYPASLLRRPSGLVVIDAEFCHWGQPAFDFGVLFAHLEIAAWPARAEVLSFFEAARGDAGLARGFAGVEILRRTLGYAQLSLSGGLERRRRLCERAFELLGWS